MNDLLQRLRRERRVALIHFIAFLAIAVVVHLLGAAESRHSIEASDAPPQAAADAVR
ncbi:MAG TPA: hypothetical protein PLO37_18295 [Candidatus Hydrogenedentes bacterium]|nr:hypothetical protein [Candidatus Hydrogenedentota bacterium]HPG68802.1 hypothetical protein [Candidatus Hydrogenedentota bacterium]